MNVLGELLRTMGWSIRMRRLTWALRIKQYATLAALMATLGIAMGYVVATRDVTDDARSTDSDRAE